MLPSCSPVTAVPGGGCWAAAPSLWRTGPGAGGGSGCEEGACGRRGRGLRHGKGETGAGTTCTCPGVGVGLESEGGLVSWWRGAGLGDPGRLRVWV